ncbi:response regulator [Paracoccus liaowanqingii]|uniref:Response regulator n=1 Tax=Paracoccus liaowanqingii TaxID=2560053 RepID=A0A4Z1CEV2_9RHOB|nr:response regulator [Paracoccus liaowanqingii]TGN51517.1 response regulator [Paracoccus liaowanqingii]
MEVNILFPSRKPAFDYALLFELAPHLIWATIFAVIILMLGPKRLVSAFLNARKLSFGGFEVDLKGDISEAVQAKGVDVSSHLEGQVARRVQRSTGLTAGARMLWIDENPDNNTIEIQLFKRLGFSIDLATSNEDATKRLAENVYDVVLSSWTRLGDGDAGRNFVPTVRAAMLNPPIIFYVGKVREVPVDAFGLTVRPDELLNLVLDALERKRG